MFFSYRGPPVGAKDLPKLHASRVHNVLGIVHTGGSEIHMVAAEGLGTIRGKTLLIHK